MTQNEIVLAIANAHLVKIVSESTILVQLVPNSTVEQQIRHLVEIYPIELESKIDGDIPYAIFITDPILFANLKAAKLAIMRLSKDEYWVFKQWQDDSRLNE